MISILQLLSILCGGKRAWPPKFLGEYEEKSKISFFLSHTNFLIIPDFLHVWKNFFGLNALRFVFWHPNAKISLISGVG